MKLIAIWLAWIIDKRLARVHDLDDADLQRLVSSI